MAGTLPPELLERARALRDGVTDPVPARDAATVALLRDGGGGAGGPGSAGVEVYLLRRVRGMAFAGGMHVFPGGAVDPDDAHADLRWAGPPPGEFAAALSCDEPLARALVCAAVRETFEEAGVLLAGPSPTEVLADVSTDEWEAERVALEAREQSLSQLLSRRGLVLRADLLRPLAHWITPEIEPKRFDTRFFVAEMPPGQACRHAGSEADQRLWVRPAAALAQGLRMMPPTATVLEDLARFPDAASALAAPRAITTVMPRFVVDEDDAVSLVMPGDERYGAP